MIAFLTNARTICKTCAEPGKEEYFLKELKESPEMQRVHIHKLLRGKIMFFIRSYTAKHENTHDKIVKHTQFNVYIYKCSMLFVSLQMRY